MVGTVSADSTEIPTQSDDTSTPRAVWARLDWADRVTVGLVVFQLGLLAWAAYPGSFLGDDLVRSTEAARAPLSTGYLLSDVFGHLAPGYRLVFWLQAHTVPLDHAAATTLLLAVQAGTFALAWRTFRLIFGTGGRALLPMVVYAVSPLALPSFLWWSSAVNLVPCHLAILAATRWHVLAIRTGRTLPTLYATLAIAAGLMFWEKTGLVLVELPLLTLALLPGSLLSRLREIVRMWWRWLLYWSPVAVLAVQYLTGRYSSPAADLPFAHAVGVVRSTVWDGVLPALVGGPLRWDNVEGYFGVADAPAWTSWAGLAVLLGVTAAAVWRRRGRSLAPVAYVVVPFLLGAFVTAYGRGEAFGPVIARDYRYLSDLLPVIAIAAGLALVAHPGGTVERPAPPRPTVLPTLAPRRLPRAVAVACALALVAVATTSTLRYAESWHRNPVGTYLANARTSLSYTLAEPRPMIYDSSVPASLVNPLFTPYDRPSGMLGALRRPPLYDEPHADPQLLDESGRLRPARLEIAAISRTGPDPACGWWSTGGTVTIPLHTPAPRGRWTVVVYYLALAATPATVTVDDGSQEHTTYQNRARRSMPAGLGRLYAHTADAPVAAVSISGLTARTCVMRVDVGRPVPADAP
jgi:hypothetical protein